MKYITRVIDREIDSRAKAFGAINIVGPKGCGKTRTAKERCKTTIEFQDEDKRDGYLAVAETSPGLFLRNERPILFDEWQDAPKIWGTVRKACDDAPGVTGAYYLTGSTSKDVDIPHTGTGRISTVTMYPMSLWETGESNGTVSLSKLFEDQSVDIDGCINETSLDQLFFAVCRGGWPRCLYLTSDRSKLEIARDYFQQIYQKDIQALDGVKRNSNLARTLLLSYARNMGTTAKRKSIYADVNATFSAADATLLSYIDALEKLYVVKDIDAWTPQIRSKTAIRAAKKHIFIDPSIGLAALGISPEYFNNDLDLFGHAFENLVLRDLLAYAEAEGARVMHYTDDTGVEADAVYQLADGRYALIEIKTGANAIPAAEKGLLKFRDVIKKHNEEASADSKHPGVMYREPDLLIIICANAPMAYTTENGVKVIPFGCLRD